MQTIIRVPSLIYHPNPDIYLKDIYLLMVLSYRSIVPSSRDVVVKDCLKLSQKDIGGTLPFSLVVHLYNVPLTIH